MTKWWNAKYARLWIATIPQAESRNDGGGGNDGSRGLKVVQNYGLLRRCLAMTEGGAMTQRGAQGQSAME